MESIYLKTLVEVAGAGNITKAAETLGVTQSAASRRIKFLEDQYGLPLLDRSGPVLLLTPAGRLVLAQAQRVLQLERDLASKLDLMERRQGLALVCTPTFGLVHLPGILREFMAAHAEVCDLKCEFEMPEVVVAGMKCGRYELGVLEHCHCFDLSEFETVSLRGDQLVFAAAPGLALGGGELPLDRLLDQTLFTRGEGCCSRHLLASNLLTAGRRVEDFRRVVEFDDLLVTVEALVRGEGLAFLSRDLVQAHVAAGRLREYTIPGFSHERSRTLVIGRGVSTRAAAAAFVDQVVSRLGPASRPETALRAIR